MTEDMIILSITGAAALLIVARFVLAMVLPESARVNRWLDGSFEVEISTDGFSGDHGCGADGGD